MIICEPCRKEMACTKTGKRVVYAAGHVYAGDQFTCPGCGAVVVVTSKTPYHDPNAANYPPETAVQMP